jgi:hypothetical protein
MDCRPSAPELRDRATCYADAHRNQYTGDAIP